MESDHEILLTTQVHWFSHGKVLKRTLKFKDELYIFFSQKFQIGWLLLGWQVTASNRLPDRYLQNNRSTLFHQRKGVVLKMCEKVNTVLKKCILWKEHFVKQMFGNVSSFVAEKMELCYSKSSYICTF